MNNKSDKCINWTTSNISRPDNLLAITSIKDTILSNSTSRIEALVLDENEQINYIQNDKQKRYKIFIIGDHSGTSPLLVYDDLIDILQTSESFIFTQIKSKKIHNQLILSTTANSTIEKSTNVSKGLTIYIELIIKHYFRLLFLI